MSVINEQKNCQWRIARRPSGNVVNEDFSYHEEEIPVIRNNELLLKTLYLNLAPVMRMYMSGESIAGEKGLDIGEIIHGRGVAEVIESNNSAYKPGDIIQGQIGWQTFKKTKVTEKERFRKMNKNFLYPSFDTIAGSALVNAESFFGDAKVTMSDRLYLYRFVKYEGTLSAFDRIGLPEFQIVINGHATELGDLEQIMELRRSYLLQQTIS